LRGGQIGQEERIADPGHEIGEKAQEDQVFDPEVLFPHSEPREGLICLRTLSLIS
jgi:hypothetical protein